ncbi:hypothetical protein [Halobacillus sp. Marseille-Q1614]|uniref:hypothetical protein n=1 Tax=Halobacillus sp. Marseille-Q1614 TaxID=2709134 RepID=UPI001570B624|nr:hypothetical protein [Halobacillus sp. Marseille-Q1614]
MNDLLELIFSNFLIVAAVIGGLISWFSNSAKEEERKQNRPQRSRPAGSKPVGRPTMKQASAEMEETKDRVQEYYEQRKKLDSDSHAETNVEKNNYGTSRYSDRMNQGNTLEVLVQEDSKKDKVQINYSKKWDRSKLANGIIMAEILGQPRAYKPHSSHPRKR